LATESMPADVAAAYRHCEHITRTQARNFSYGIRLLPPPKRRALSAVYAFARRVDDIGDGTLPAAEKLALLDEARKAAADPAAFPDDLALVGLADTARRFPIPLSAFGELIDGCAADVRGTNYATFDELLHYCRCVAGSIGRLSLGVFGATDPEAAEPLADALGVALQLTNILRDIREDHAGGRVYLPAEDIERFGCRLAPGSPGPGEEPAPGEQPGSLADLVRFEAQRARTWYSTGLGLLPLLDRRSAACTAAMAGIYRRLLDRIAAAPDAAIGGRMSLPGWEKIWVAARSLAGGLA
jgi:15-cis-phytoene synthase